MLWHMRKMLNMKEEEPASDKAHATTVSGRSAGEAVDAASAVVDRLTGQGGGERVHLKTVKGRGVQLGFDLDSSASLLKQLEMLEQFQ